MQVETPKAPKGGGFPLYSRLEHPEEHLKLSQRGLRQAKININNYVQFDERFIAFGTIGEHV